MPTALLPRFGVKWTAIDNTHALATLAHSATRVSLEFTFTASRDVERIYTPARARAVDGRYEPTPWMGQFRRYADRCGMWVPLQGEVAWQIGGVWRQIWRGQNVRVECGSSTQPASR